MEEPSFHERSLQDLEWSEVCAAIATYAHSDLGKARARALAPAEDREGAELRLSVMREALALHGEGASIPAAFIRDVLLSLERVKRGGVASGEEVAAVTQMLTVVGALDRFGGAHESSAPLLGRVLSVSEELGPLARILRAAVDEEGVVRDDASDALSAARVDLKALRSQVQKRIEELIGRYRDALQDGYYAEREGRYVLPVRADAPYRVEGIVLGTSSSGSTLYIEPKELGSLANKLRLAEIQVEREVALVLASLSSTLSPHADELIWAQDVCVRADFLHAAVLFSASMGAQIAKFADPGVMMLKAARHPLLCVSGIEVVASDLQVTPHRALVLSGPNAGGKTVALKTLGLLALMQSSGLPVPAHPESQIGFFSEVLCDIGDDQSLSMSLSSFSGHIQRVRNILDEAGHGTLVLFDELMGGTDPDEGAVLAIATVEELLRADASVCVTTHYEPLKAHASTSPNFQNAAVGFDFDKMEPTFAVEMGRPGVSSAIIVAERHGLPSRVTAFALHLLPDVLVKKRQESLDIEEQVVLLRRERAELVQAKEEHERANRRLLRETERLKKERSSELSHESDSLREEVKEARAEVRRIKVGLRGAGSENLRRLSDELGQASSVVSLGSPAEREIRKARCTAGAPLVSAKQLSPGTKVRVRGFSACGVVVDIGKKGQVRVLLGVMKMSVPVSELELVEKAAGASSSFKEKEKSSRTQRVSLEPVEATRTPPVRSESTTLDLRGHRVEESLLEVDQFVDGLLQRQEPGGFVLHGHGTGALKESVRQHLRAHSCVIESRAAIREEGGDAFTLFWLAGS